MTSEVMNLAYTLDETLLKVISCRKAHTHVGKHKHRNNRRISMSLAEFEPTIVIFQRFEILAGHGSRAA
jgi:hypothetical protein